MATVKGKTVDSIGCLVHPERKTSTVLGFRTLDPEKWRQYGGLAPPLAGPKKRRQYGGFGAAARISACKGPKVPPHPPTSPREVGTQGAGRGRDHGRDTGRRRRDHGRDPGRGRRDHGRDHAYMLIRCFQGISADPRPWSPTCLYADSLFSGYIRGPATMVAYMLIC